MIETSVTKLPDCSTIDFANGCEVAAYSHLVLSLMQHEGITSCDRRPTSATSALLRQSKEWIRAVEEHVTVTPTHELIVALNGFDLINRITFKIPASSKFIGECYMKAFNELIRGNRAISDIDLYGAISDRIRLRDKNFLDKPLQWQSLTVGQWYKECIGTGEFRTSSLDQSLHKARFLLDKDLFAFTGRNQESFKDIIASHYLSKVTSTGCDNGPTLRAKLAFLQSNRRRFSSYDDAYTIEQELLTALSQSADTHPLDRLAYRLDAQFKATLAEAI